MTRSNIVNVLVVVAALVVMSAAQTRSQNQQGQTGRYQLLSAQYRWPGVDAQSKVVFDEREHLCRIDSVTGETSILLVHPPRMGSCKPSGHHSANNPLC
jgi:hypothetical protein